MAGIGLSLHLGGLNFIYLLTSTTTSSPNPLLILLQDSATLSAPSLAGNPGRNPKRQREFPPERQAAEPGSRRRAEGREHPRLRGGVPRVPAGRRARDSTAASRGSGARSSRGRGAASSLREVRAEPRAAAHPGGGCNPIKGPARPPPPPLPFPALPDEGESPSAARRALPALLPARLPRKGDAGLGPRPGRRRGNAEHMEVPGRCRFASLLLLLASCIGCAAAPRRSIPRRQGRDPRRGCGGCSRRETVCPERFGLSAPRSFASLYNWQSLERPSLGPGGSLRSGDSGRWEKPECCPEPRPAPLPALTIGEAAVSA